MKVTEKELNYILSESVLTLLNEDNPFNTTNRQQNANTFNNAYQKQIGKMGWWNSGVGSSGTKASGVDRDANGDITSIQTGDDSRKGMNWSRVGGNVLKNTAIASAVPFVGTAVSTLAGAFNPTLGLQLSGLLTLVAGGLIIKNLIGSITQQVKFRNLKLPTFAKNVPRYAKMAAIEKSKAQQICLELQNRINFMLQAYKVAAIQSANTQTPWTTKEIRIEDIIPDNIDFQNTYKGGQQDNIKVKHNIDFTDKNAGRELSTNESKNSRTLLENNQQLSQMVQTFLKQGEDKTKKTMEEVGQLFAKAYSNWMQWVKYIGGLCAKFPQVAKWDAVINGTVQGPKDNGRGFINGVKNFVQNNDTGNKNWNQSNTSDNQYNINKDIYIVVSDNWKYYLRSNSNAKRKKYYIGILLQNLTTNKYICVSTGQTQQVNFTQGTQISYQYSENDNTGEYAIEAPTRNQKPTDTRISAILLNDNAKNSMKSN